MIFYEFCGIEQDEEEEKKNNCNCWLDCQEHKIFKKQIFFLKIKKNKNYWSVILEKEKIQ